MNSSIFGEWTLGTPSLPT